MSRSKPAAANTGNAAAGPAHRSVAGASVTSVTARARSATWSAGSSLGTYCSNVGHRHPDFKLSQAALPMKAAEDKNKPKARKLDIKAMKCGEYTGKEEA